MKILKVLGISGSLRRHSTNTGLLRWAQQQAPEGMIIEIADLIEIPFYNADHGNNKPPSLQRLLTQTEQADALLLACPEYNYSIAPALKNAFDWISREPDNHLLAGKPVAILSSGGGQGGARAQYHLRQVCVFLNLHPINKPEIFCNAFSDSFAADGSLVNIQTQELIVSQLKALRDWQKRLSRD